VKDTYRLFQQYDPKTILDYGAGTGFLAQSLPFLDIHSYDPGVPKFSTTPDPADFVVCMHTLEHIEPECLDAVLDDIQRCTLNLVYFIVSMYPSSYTLSDGRNAHLIQKPVDWWFPKLMDRFQLKQAQCLNNYNYFWFLGMRKNDVAVSVSSGSHTQTEGSKEGKRRKSTQRRAATAEAPTA
jgi:hypothetical protein